MKISDTIFYIGADDHEVDLFEGQYRMPNGMSYNSYVILDDRIAVMDTVDGRFAEEWLRNLEEALNGRRPDYLVIQHMEPDHSAGIPLFLQKYPDAKVVATPKAFVMMDQFFEGPAKENRIPAENGSILELGAHVLQFHYAPMVHWPEVMMTYEQTEKLLFSADAFGKFGALDADEPWLSEARRYYIGIVGKFGAQVQAVLKKAASLDIHTICPLHGPVLSENLGYYLDKYQSWSSYQPEETGIVIAYASIYGNTAAAANYLAEKLQQTGERVILHDLSRTDMAQAVADAFCCDRLILACSTYNGGIFPCMRRFIEELLERNYQNRMVGLMENGSWAPTAAAVMKKMFEKSRNISFAENVVKILSAMKEEDKARVEKLAEEISAWSTEKTI